MTKWPLSAAAACLCAFASCQTQSDSLQSISNSPLHAVLVHDAGALEARLDDALAHHRYGEIVQQTSAIMAAQNDAQRIRVLNWERDKDLSGQTDSTFVIATYAEDLQAEANHLSEPNRSAWLKLATTSYLRVTGTILSESVQCRRPAIADGRLAALSQTLEPLRGIVNNYDEEERRSIARDVDLLIQFSFPGRYPDDWLCNGAFKPYAIWEHARIMALEAFRKSLALPEIKTRPIPKNPAIIPLYG